MALLAQTLRRSFLETRSILPPAFLLPFRANITTVSHGQSTGTVTEPLIQSGQQVPKDIQQQAAASPDSTKPVIFSRPASQIQKDATPSPLTPSIRHLLPLLHTQPSHYLTIHIHGHPYLITRGDSVRLPFLMPKVKPGDVLRLNRATHIGSRDYTLKAPEAIKGTRDAVKQILYLDERLFVCRAMVVGIESEPMRVLEKTKRRQRHVKHVYSKHKFTVLKISEVEIRSLEEYEALLEEK
ncbi:hypothetical protein K505DRAFT_322442 [Melanomma pulvis-pyrius CBS 109.77]|uniref:Large ribosomal subunit protein bL21m n=1 Tax=Melanomma pulvis-pyrius CBS 109.77 TaxID=1314802 RepID=A0A6A6XN70_9PLEO|nr:hypothetical protein K505DRAFT_322442 [Melanomma pulvis-pyrius CBS 109.77]